MKNYFDNVPNVDNVALLTDGYKFSHPHQLPEGTGLMSAYFEARNKAEFPYSKFIGLQMIMMDHFMTPVTMMDIDAAKVIVDQMAGPGVFHYEGWKRIVEVHGGYMPVSIRAVGEGTRVPKNNILMDVTSLDEKLPWVVGFMETVLTHVWYPTAVATLSAEIKQIILNGLEISGDVNDIAFKLNDFGFRGATCVQAAGRGGLGHLSNFSGTDTTIAVLYGMKYYGSGVMGFTIPASEHSTVTIYGPKNEIDAHKNMIKQFPTGPRASVLDSFDYFGMLKRIATELKDEILALDGVFVCRPDSGKMVPTMLKSLDILEAGFGTTLNAKGYKVLPPQIRIIWGDGCNIDTIKQTILAVIAHGFSIDNICFGMGGGLLQLVTRDTQHNAFKCSYAEVNGIPRDVRKDPITDPGKKSKTGRMSLVKGAVYTTMDMNRAGQNGYEDQLREVWNTGVFTHLTTWEQIQHNGTL